jgi:hypothetical protein
MESMNRANKVARDRTAVDVVCATKLLLSLSAKRYHEKKEIAREEVVAKQLLMVNPS